jgi:hypothetical protein
MDDNLFPQVAFDSSIARIPRPGDATDFCAGKGYIQLDWHSRKSTQNALQGKKRRVWVREIENDLEDQVVIHNLPKS